MDYTILLSKGTASSGKTAHEKRNLMLNIFALPSCIAIVHDYLGCYVTRDIMMYHM